MFFKSKQSKVKTTPGEKVWLSEAEKIRQLTLICNHAAKQHQTVILTAHFRDTIVALAEALKADGTPFYFFNSRTLGFDAMPEGSASTIYLISSFNFSVKNMQVFSAFPNNVQVYCAERYPLRKRDEDVVTFFAGQQFESQIEFIVALDDPLLKFFGSERTTTILQHLGMKPDECISHPLISKSIEQAQDKIARKARSDVQTDSAKTWFEQNKLL